MLDIEVLEKTYFYFDEPVEYEVEKDKKILIKPVTVKSSEIFLSSVGILTVDKNSMPSVEIIQMSYLQFMLEVLCQDKANFQRMINLFVLCLDIKHPYIKKDELGRLQLYDKDRDLTISGKKFDEIKKIILYQNLPHYDDDYINPELKKAINEVDELKNRDIVPPSIERRMAIITAHCGISKKEQMDMTLRAHTLLFEEVVGEVEFTTVRPIALYAGVAAQMEHWIYKKKKNKLDGYITDVDTYTSKMGGDYNAVHSTTNTAVGDKLTEQFNNFKK